MGVIMENKKADASLLVRYGFGEFACQISWYMINSYLMIFYTDIVGLTAGAISIIMLIARVWDALNDPMMGMLCDRTRTRWGKFRPYLMFTPPFLAIFNILTFTVFPLEGAAKVFVCLICYVGAGMLYTVVGTAYFSLVNVVAKDSQSKQNLSAARNVGNSVANILLSAICMPLILKFSSAVGADGTAVPDARGYFMVAVIFSVAMIPTFWIAASCKETYGSILHKTEEGGEKRSILDSIKTLLKNDQLVLIILNTLGGTIAIMGRMTLLSFYVIYVVGSYTLIAPIYLVISVGTLLGSFLIPMATRRLGKKNYMILLNLVMITTFVLMYFSTQNTVLIMVISFVTGLSNTGQGVSYGMISDSIDYCDYKYGIREEGLSSSFLTLGVKFATAVIGTCGVLFLDKTGYVPNQIQTPEVQQSINFLINIVPAICVGVALIPLFFFKLSNEKMAEISAVLEERRSK